MNFFSIRDIENLSGIKAHTLRIWEQRYNLINPKRKVSRHRFYDNEDLKYILRIAYLYKLGYKISLISSLGEEEIKKLALETKPGDSNHGVYINQLTEASIDFDPVRFEQTLHDLLQQINFEKAVMQVFFPLLNRMGLLWLTGNVIPAQEHFASSMIINKLFKALDDLDPVEWKEGDQRVLLFTPAGEFHEIPILFMQYLIKKNGIPHISIGKNTSLDVLKLICERQPITHLYFHLITSLPRCSPQDYLTKLSGLFPDKQIVCAGTRLADLDKTPPNVHVLKTDAEMYEFCRRSVMA